jgi:branched-chain amino acid transport system ATP-binding protein
MENQQSATALRVENIAKQFGALRAVGGVSLNVNPGERRAIIGPNGAGKTTFFNLISGALPVTSGTIYLGGRDVTKLPDWKRARLGLARTFQRNNLFTGLTVFENVRLAIQHHTKSSYNMFKAARTMRHINERVAELLAQVGLYERSNVEVHSLSYGEQRQLEVAIALATEPNILLLDEPTAGMSVAETHRMIDLIKNLPSQLTLMIVEHDMDVVFAIADRITVLHLGQVLTEDTPEAVRADTRVREVYFGEE